VVIAEAIKLDTGLVVAILLIALGSFLLVATVTGLLGVGIGVALARRTQSPETVRGLRRGKRVWVGVVGVGATIVSWILLFSVGVAISDDAWGLVLVYLGGLPLPIAWGWWNGRWYGFDGKPDVPPSNQPLPPPTAAVDPPERPR
jgi:amino acid transporter